MNLISYPSSCSSGIAVNMIGSESLVSNGKETTTSTCIYAVRNWLLLSLASSSGSNTRWYVSLTGGRGRSDIRGGVSIAWDISSFVVSEWATILSVDAVSSGVHELLILNSRYSANCESGNLL